MMEPENSKRSIVRLDPAVVNKIAAGEVLQRPANAVKELLENSLDAGATEIKISIKGGGIKLIQIKDNGKGIPKEDLALACERFATSKLTKVEELRGLTTFGFRGEALSSIATVSHVSIITMTSDSPCAHKAVYASSGSMNSLNPCAGTKGTQVIVEDLFYSMDMRRRTLKSAPEEYKYIADVVKKYAVHKSGIAFHLSRLDLHEIDVHTLPSASAPENIRAIYGVDIADEVLPVSFQSKELQLTFHGYCTNANYSTKQGYFILFINDRLVENSSMKKAVSGIYSNMLPKGGKFFCYLSLSVPSPNIDVNVHPTKNEVHLLNEKSIIESLQRTVETALKVSEGSRKWNVAPNVTISAPQSLKSLVSKYAPKSTLAPLRDITNQVPVNDAKRIYTSNANISFSGITSAATRSITPLPKTRKIIIEDDEKKNEDQMLTSIQNLIREMQSQTHKGITKMLTEHSFVGCANENCSVLEYQDALYLVNHCRLSEDLFYQTALYNFQKMNSLILETPLPIVDLLLTAIDFLKISSGSEEEQLAKAKMLSRVIIDHKEMLSDYFSIKINAKDHLYGIPDLLPGYQPLLMYLPLFIYQLAAEVDWSTEEACFREILMEIASFYAIKPSSLDNDESPGQDLDLLALTVQPFLEACRKLQGSSHLVSDGSVSTLTTFHRLMTLFERC